MKRIPILIGIFLVCAAAAETPSKEESLETAAARRAKETPPALDLNKPNEITAGPISYSGIAIETIRIDDLVQLVNPGAPGRYGFAEDNVVRDPINGTVSGLKLFSIQF